MAGKFILVSEGSNDFSWALVDSRKMLIAKSEHNHSSIAEILENLKLVKLARSGGNTLVKTTKELGLIGWKLVGKDNTTLAISSQYFKDENAYNTGVSHFEQEVSKSNLPGKNDPVIDKPTYVSGTSLEEFYSHIVGATSIIKGTSSTPNAMRSKNEFEYIKKRRQQSFEESEKSRNSENVNGELNDAPTLGGFEKRNSRPPIGYAASGGGIRSGLFNMGIFQSLSRTGFFPWIDYLSSVSGGGLGASTLISLLSKRNTPFKGIWEKFPFNPDIVGFDPDGGIDPDEGFDPDGTKLHNGDEVDIGAFNYASASTKVSPGGNTQLKHLINKGNFIIPRLGLLSRDTLRFLGSFISKLGYTLLLFLSLLLIIAGIHYLATATLIPSVSSDIDVLALNSVTPSATFTSTSEIPATPTSELAINIYLNVTPTASNTPTETDSEINTGALILDATSTPVNYSEFGFLFGKYYSVVENPTPEKGSFELPIFTYVQAIVLGALFPFLVWWLFLPAFDQKKSQPPKSIEIGESVTYRLNYIRQRGLLLLGILLAIGVAWLIKSNGISSSEYLSVYPVWLGLLIIWLLIHIYILAVLKKRENDASWIKGGMNQDFKVDSDLIQVLVGAGFAFNILGTLFVRERYLASFEASDGLSINIFLIWIPVAIQWGIIWGTNFLRQLTSDKQYASRKKRTRWGDSDVRSFMATLQGANLGAILGLILLNVVSAGLIFVDSSGTVSESGSFLGILLSGGYAAYLGRNLGKSFTGSESWLTKFIQVSPSLRPYVFGLLVVVLNLLILFLFESFIDGFWSANPDGLYGISPLLITLGFIIVTILLTRFNLQTRNFNYVSQHYFARDRFSEYFLSTEIENSRGVSYRVRDDRRTYLKDINPDNSVAPYHIVQTGLNLSGTWHLKYKDRKAHQFEFSRLFSGSEVTGYARSSRYRKGRTKYSRALTLSGAPLATGIGRHTFFAQAYLFTMLNLRLGLWVLNPKIYEDEPKSNLRLAMLREKYEGARFSNMGELKLEYKPNWGKYLLDEALAKISERRDLVNLVDGAVMGDNNALYPLFKRRCNLIIVGAGGADPKGTAEELFRVIEQVKQEFGILVKINVDHLQPLEKDKDGNKKGWSAKHAAIGEVTYPSINVGGQKLESFKGWLLLFKPTITGDEPASIKKYWEMHSDTFPHRSTGDQMFDERQVEYQRFLGELTVVHALEDLKHYYADKNNKKGSSTLKTKIREIALERLLQYKGSNSGNQGKYDFGDLFIPRKYVDKNGNPVSKANQHTAYSDLDEFMEDWKKVLDLPG